MDALEQFLGGGAVASPPQSKNASVVTDELLDSLRKVESGKDKFALNKDTKAMGPYQFMPETVQMLHKQGIEFNPFNEKQAREAARTYLGQLVDRNKGDVDKALAQYGGFVTKDPSGYVNKVKQGQAPAAAPATQPATQPTAPAETVADPLEAFLSGKPVPAQTTNQASQTESTTSTQEGTMGAYVPRRQPVNPVRQILDKYTNKNVNLGENVAGAIDTLYGVVPATIGAAISVQVRNLCVADFSGHNDRTTLGVCPEVTVDDLGGCCPCNGPRNLPISEAHVLNQCLTSEGSKEEVRG